MLRVVYSPDGSQESAAILQCRWNATSVDGAEAGPPGKLEPLGEIMQCARLWEPSARTDMLITTAKLHVCKNVPLASKIRMPVSYLRRHGTFSGVKPTRLAHKKALLHATKFSNTRWYN